jgi:hypothetical protein
MIRAMLAVSKSFTHDLPCSTYIEYAERGIDHDHAVRPEPGMGVELEAITT